MHESDAWYVEGRSRERRAGWLALLFLFPLAGCGGEPDDLPDEGGRDRTGAPQEQAPLPEGAQARSLLGEPLFPPSLSEEVRARRGEDLTRALADLEAAPEDADAIIWAGRRYAYLGRYREAIETFTRGIELHPDDARLYRHRGHRFITVRELDRAIADFRRAAELVEGEPDRVEPDGQPNALGVPTSTLHFNIWYHYGLAHYLKGEFQEAADRYRRCMAVSEHPDSKIATAHWWYMTLRRLDREDEAFRLVRGLDLPALEEGVIESGSYLALLRVYAGLEEPETFRSELRDGTLEGATLGYGIGNWYVYNGSAVTAREIFRDIVGDRSQWAAFGYIAAEADLARMAEGG